MNTVSFQIKLVEDETTHIISTLLWFLWDDSCGEAFLRVLSQFIGTALEMDGQSTTLV